MNKHELKSLLENIYEAMILPSLADQALSNPSLMNPKPITPVTPKPTWSERPRGTPEDLIRAIQWADNLIGENGLLVTPQVPPGFWTKPGWTMPIDGRNLTLQEYILWIEHARGEAQEQQEEN